MPTVQHHMQTAGDMIAQIAMSPAAIAGTVASAVSTPWWLPHAKNLADGAALALPVFGCVLAILQIVMMLMKIRKGVDGDE